MNLSNPFERPKFPREVVLMTVGWYSSNPLSFRDVQDMLAKRDIPVDASTNHPWVPEFGPEIRK